MKRILKWIGTLLGGVIALAIIAAGIMYILAGNRLNKTYDIEPNPITISAETAVLTRGQYLYSVSCAGCHGSDLSGSPFIDDPALGTIPAPNLTTGQGGAGASYNDADFARAIRHGVDLDGKPLAIMPSSAFWHFSDEDLGAIIAYIKNAAPIDNEFDDKNVLMMGRILMSAGALDILAAESIDHTGSPPAAPDQGATIAYGEYLVNTGDCRQCHGAPLSGAQPAEPGAPFAPNLTPGGESAKWATEDFVSSMRTGNLPDGRSMNANFMPWESYSKMTDDDLTAVFLYLQSLPSLESTQ